MNKTISSVQAVQSPTWIDFEFFFARPYYCDKQSDRIVCHGVNWETAFIILENSGYTEGEIREFLRSTQQNFTYLNSPYYGKVRRYLPVDVPKPVHMVVTCDDCSRDCPMRRNGN